MVSISSILSDLNSFVTVYLVNAGLVFDFELFIDGRCELLSDAEELLTKFDEQVIDTNVGPNLC